MQQREKILAASFAGTLGVFVVVPMLWSWFNGPVADARAELDVEKVRREAKDTDLLLTLAKQRRLKEWKGRSLSPRPQEAALQYQQWLSDLAEVVAEFSSVQVAPEATAAAANQPYAVINFRLKAEGTLAQVRLFLFRFLQADLLHRVKSIVIDSPTTAGNPKLSLNMQFEALSLLKDAPPRGPTLFARTQVAEDWKSSTQALRVQPTDAFPKTTPYLMRVGGRYFEVRDVQGTNWTLAPDVNSPQLLDGSFELLEGETVELVQVHPEYAKRTLADFDPILKQNPFLKPVPYAPKLEFVGAKSVSRGGTLQLQCKASGFDLVSGEPSFAISGDLPKGMTFEAATGKLTWKPADEQPLGDVSLNVTATAPGLKEALTESLKLSLKQLNKAPTIATIGERHAVLGKEFVLPIKATDEDSDGKLTFSLGSGAPEGAKIDSATGELRWTPAATMVPGPVKLTVQVADAGLPPMTATQEITINLGDDLAQFTVLTGIIVREGEKEFWLSDKSNNRRLVLHEGETLRYADVAATVERIEKKFVLLRKDDTTWRLDLGENLKSLRKVETPAAPATPKQSG